MEFDLANEARPRDRRFLDATPSPPVALAVVIFLVAAVALIDAATGPYMMVAIFYLVPVSIAAWFLDRTAALLVSVLGAVAGAVVTLADPGVLSDTMVLWNALVRLATFVLFALVIARERRTLDALDRLALHDPLTGLANRRGFFGSASVALAAARSRGVPVAVLFVDVDGLKERNDRAGHDAGDRLLQQVSLELALVGAAALGRLGGDEFCLVLVDCDAQRARGVADGILATLRRGPDGPITASIGVVVDGPGPTRSVDDYVNHADSLMLLAKRSGKARIELDSMTSEALDGHPPAA